MKATVFIENLQVDTIIGICDWEQTQEQPLYFDVAAQVGCDAVAESDSITHALDYAQVAEKLTDFVQASELKLLEPLLVALGQFLLKEYLLIEALELSVRKPLAIEKADCAGISIQLSR